MGPNCDKISSSVLDCSGNFFILSHLFSAKSLPAKTPPVLNIHAVPTASAVVVDGVNTSFDAYNIEGSNYFKLRDIAYVLSGTEKQFEVGWDSHTPLLAVKWPAKQKEWVLHFKPHRKSTSTAGKFNSPPITSRATIRISS